MAEWGRSKVLGADESSFCGYPSFSGNRLPWASSACRLFADTGFCCTHVLRHPPAATSPTKAVFSTAFHSFSERSAMHAVTSNVPVLCGQDFSFSSFSALQVKRTFIALAERMGRQCSVSVLLHSHVPLIELVLFPPNFKTGMALSSCLSAFASMILQGCGRIYLWRYWSDRVAFSGSGHGRLSLLCLSQSWTKRYSHCVVCHSYETAKCKLVSTTKPSGKGKKSRGLWATKCWNKLTLSSL